MAGDVCVVYVNYPRFILPISLLHQHKRKSIGYDNTKGF